MGWLEVHIATQVDFADTISEQLTELGALAITLSDAGNAPVYEPAPGETPLWQHTQLISLFDDQHDMSAVIAYLHAEQEAKRLSTFETKALADQAWERVCLQDFKPLRFGRRLWVCPSWETPPDAQAVNIVLDPGLAFGTGTSPTTALCLEWLDEHVQAGTRFIDYGCGSGILALAALKLGAKHVAAVDYDPQAITATRENGLRNQLIPPALDTYLPDDFHSSPVDLVIANILAKSLIELAPRLAAWVQPQGQILLSGILREQAAEVAAAYAPWFTMDAPTAKEEWVRLSGKKNNP